MITKIDPTVPIINKEARPTRQLQDFFVQVELTGIITGDGSPEGVVEASQTQMYMDESGVAGAILYIKKNADVSGDRSLGWILI